MQTPNSIRIIHISSCLEKWREEWLCPASLRSLTGNRLVCNSWVLGLQPLNPFAFISGEAKKLYRSLNKSTSFHEGNIQHYVENDNGWSPNTRDFHLNSWRHSGRLAVCNSFKDKLSRFCQHWPLSALYTEMSLNFNIYFMQIEGVV